MSDRQGAGCSPKKFMDLVREVLKVCPEATFGEDFEGQLVIYTNLAEVDKEGTLARFSGEDDSCEANQGQS